MSKLFIHSIFVFIIILICINTVLSSDKCRHEWRDTYSQDIQYSQMMEVNGILYVTGQAGFGANGIPDDIESQIENTFGNIENVLSQTGATINDAFLLRSYLVNETANAILQDIKSKRYPNWYPSWTALNVKRLWLPELQVEMEVFAKKPKPNTVCEVGITSF